MRSSLQIDTGNGSSIAIGQALRRSGRMNNGTLNGKSVGRGSRVAHPGGGPVSEALAFLLSTNGQGSMSIAEDQNQGGTFTQLSDSGTYSVASNGRAIINFMGGGTVFCYVVASNEAFCINSNNGAETTFFEPQATGSFNNAYITGEFLGGSLPQHVPATDSSINQVLFDGIGSLSVTNDQSGPSGTLLNQTESGSYSVGDTGAITLMLGGNPVGYGFVVGPNKFTFVTVDGNPRTLVEVTSSAPHHH